MKKSLQHYCKNFDMGVDKIRKLSQDFCNPLGITVFAYGRVYRDATTSWLTSSPDQDRFLLEANGLEGEPLFDMSKPITEGTYLWFNDREFPGCEAFYRDRARLFRMDHGMVLIKNKEDYVEFSCYSGHLSKRPLYNLFMNEKGLFSSFIDHFVARLDRRSLGLLENGIPIENFSSNTDKSFPDWSLEDRESLVMTCGWKNLLKLSKREKESLLLYREGKTFEEIGIDLGISKRTIEHYLESVKNKLDIDTRGELYLAAEKLIQFGIIPKRVYS
jgi:DNA-binding CsgD family transcriptional regulator